MLIAVSVASHKRSGLRSPFAAKAMMRFCDGLSDDFRSSAVVEGGDGLVKNRAQHRDRFGVTINVGRNKSTNLTHDAAPLARSARRSFFLPDLAGQELQPSAHRESLIWVEQR
jgi:hypothetical protein